MDKSINLDVVPYSNNEESQRSQRTSHLSRKDSVNTKYFVNKTPWITASSHTFLPLSRPKCSSFYRCISWSKCGVTLGLFDASTSPAIGRRNLCRVATSPRKKDDEIVCSGESLKSKKHLFFLRDDVFFRVHCRVAHSPRYCLTLLLSDTWLNMYLAEDLTSIMQTQLL